MALHTTGAYAGNVTGYQSNGPEVRPDAGQPRAASLSLGSQFTGDNHPSLSAEPLGGAPQATTQERPAPRGDEDQDEADADSPKYSAQVEMPGSAYGGAAYNGGGGQLANDITYGDQRPAISGAAPRAIESAAPKIIQGTVEDVL